MTSGPLYSGANLAPRNSAGRDRLLSDGARARIVTVLRSCFNFLTLNLVLVVTSLLVVTIPMAISAAVTALDRWRVDGEDRVVREFFAALRSRPPLRTTLAIGGPLAAIALATEEVHYFARGGSPVNWVCLGFGSAALLVAVVATGHVTVLESRYPSAPITDLWSLGIRLGIHNFVVTGPLFVVEGAGAVLVGLADPALVLIGLPLVFVSLVRLTSDFGARRAPGSRP
jgi:hypothetical protein